MAQKRGEGKERHLGDLCTPFLPYMHPFEIKGHLKSVGNLRVLWRKRGALGVPVHPLITLN